MVYFHISNIYSTCSSFTSRCFQELKANICRSVYFSPANDLLQSPTTTSNSLPPPLPEKQRMSMSSVSSNNSIPILPNRPPSRPRRDIPVKFQFSVQSSQKLPIQIPHILLHCLCSVFMHLEKSALKLLQCSVV